MNLTNCSCQTGDCVSDQLISIVHYRYGTLFSSVGCRLKHLLFNSFFIFSKNKSNQMPKISLTRRNSQNRLMIIIIALMRMSFLLLKISGTCFPIFLHWKLNSLSSFLLSNFLLFFKQRGEANSGKKSK